VNAQQCFDVSVGVGATNLFFACINSGDLLPGAATGLVLQEIDDLTLQLLLERPKGADENLLAKLRLASLTLPALATNFTFDYGTTFGQSLSAAKHFGNVKSDGTTTATVETDVTLSLPPSLGAAGLQQSLRSLGRSAADLGADAVRKLVHESLRLGVALTLGRITFDRAATRKIDFRASAGRGVDPLSLAEIVALSIALPGMCMMGLETLNMARCGLTLAGADHLLPVLNSVLACGPNVCLLRSINLNENPFVQDLVQRFHSLGREAATVGVAADFEQDLAARVAREVQILFGLVELHSQLPVGEGLLTRLGNLNTRDLQRQTQSSASAITLRVTNQVREYCILFYSYILFYFFLFSHRR
jgi:hypothetical protein